MINKLKGALLGFLCIFCFNLKAEDQGQPPPVELVLETPYALLTPGDEFLVAMKACPIGPPVDFGLYYENYIAYNPSLISFLYSLPGNFPGFEPPMVSSLADGLIKVWAGAPAGCTYLEICSTLAYLVFEVKALAPVNEQQRRIEFYTPTHFIDCANNYALYAFQIPTYFSTIMFEQTTFGLQQYLDLDADPDWILNESDVNVLKALVLKKNYDTSGSMQLQIGGLQGDITGDNQVNHYDWGWLEAVARPVRFISSGTDGICMTWANQPPPSNPEDADDVQEIFPGFGAPYAIVINGDTGNGILESVKGGDDEFFGHNINSGANGIAESYALGDDQQIIPFGYGARNSVCVSPGPNGVLATQPGTMSDDQLKESFKPSGQLLSAHPPEGVPAKIVKISPSTEPAYYAQIEPIPITVSVQDANGNPKSAIAPVFTVQGEGTFQETGTNTVTGWVSDRFLDRGEIPKGEVTVTLLPTVGLNTVTVFVPGDPNKGVPDCGGVACGIPEAVFHIYVLNETPQLAPDTVSLSLGSTSVFVNQPIPITINLADGGSPAPGFAKNLYLVTDRNFKDGVWLQEIAKGKADAVFFDNFESGVLDGWSVDSSCGTITIDGTEPGFLGQKTLHISGDNSSDCILKKQINTENFIDINIGYLWRFQGSTGTGYIKSYWSSDGYRWSLLQNSSGSTLDCGTTQLCPANFNLQGIDNIENSSFYLALVFNLPEYQEVFLDNVLVKGKRAILIEDFENYAVGDFPPSLENEGLINSGWNGICQTDAEGDDLQLIPVGQGLPYVEIIYPGPNSVLDTTVPDGDDEIVGDIVNAGANGIAETFAVGDDFQAIIVGNGFPFSICILPGLNLVIDTLIIEGDDEGFIKQGPNPRIMVDNSIAGSPPGPNKFLFLGRALEGMTVENYKVRKTVNLGNFSEVILTFNSRTVGMVDEMWGAPNQEFVVEVSDNGGKTFVPIWDFAGKEQNYWTLNKIKLTNNDPRFQLVDNFIIRWRVSMNSTEESIIDPDAVYIDDIIIFAGKPPRDSFSVIQDQGNGTYLSSLTSLIPGNTVWVSAVYWANNGQTLIYSNSEWVRINMRKVDPSTIKIYPESFLLKACQSQTVQIVGHYLDLPGQQVADLTNLFRLIVNGPARQTAPGVIRMDCYRGDNPISDEPIPIYLQAVPLVPGLTDPGGGGGGQQTGTISGRVFKPNLDGAGNASVKVDMGQGNKIYSSADSNGFYLFSGVPAGTGYTVSASKKNYTKKSQSNVSVTAGQNTGVDLVLISGANYDGDSQMDSADSDDDNDTVLDVNELNGDTCHFDPDCDDDDYEDNEDAFPTNPNEWVDTDNDSTGNNSDTDDDNDGILDSEEVIPGNDGYITDPLDQDTDNDSMPDKWEVDYNLNPTSSSDATGDPDEDGIINVDEYLNGLNPNVANWGTIWVSSDPTGAKVFLDGTLAYPGQYKGLSGTGGSPLSINNLKNQKHTITIIKSDYSIYQAYVNVTLGQSFTVNPTLSYRTLEMYSQSYPVLAGGHTVQIASGFSAPHLADLDRNGTIDLLVGTGDGKVIYYSNSSSNSLNLQSGTNLQAGSTVLDAGERAKPFLVDWNNDNCVDLLVGNSVGQVKLYLGTGNCQGTFSEGTNLSAGGSTLSVPSGQASPWVADWNGDYKKDLVVGAGDGKIVRYLNIGTDSSPSLSSGLYLSDYQGISIDIGTSATPIVYDINRDGYLDLISGGGDGQIGACVYSTDVSPAGFVCNHPSGFTIYQDTKNVIDVGNNAFLGIGDINKDNQLDMIIGNSAGYLFYYPAGHLVGDIDWSGKVDAGDWILLKLSFGLCKGQSNYNPGADLNGDNCVNASDQTILSNHFGETY